MNCKSPFLPLLSALLALATVSHAQWLTQSVILSNGWNAVYLHVDASHDTLEQLVGADAGNPIQEVWLWNTPSTALQFVSNPLLPTGTGSEWTSWNRNNGPGSDLQRIIGNAAYLVRLPTNAPNFTWQIKGRPVPPAYRWTSAGLNFLGFSTPPVTPPKFDRFLAPTPDSLKLAEFYRYLGGDLSSNNPSLIPSFIYPSVNVNRGQAFWIGPTNTYNRYFGPFDLILQNSSGVDFGDALGQSTLRLRNGTSSNLTVTLQMVASETPPAGQTPIAGLPPLLMRGALNVTNLTHAYTNLAAGSRSWTLSPAGQVGSEVEVVLGVNRSQMSGPPGTRYAGVLRLTDSLGHLQLNVPTSATVASSAGLWVGVALVNQVRHYLVGYERDENNHPVVSSNGQYVATATNTSLGSVAREFPLRIILHNPTNGSPVLLQRVYYGLGTQSNLVVATRENLLAPQYLASARRISAVHLPWSAANTFWPFTGPLTAGLNLTATVMLDHSDHASNPFLHTYHPDHDNFNTRFDAAEPRGRESYSVTRQITLTVTAPGDDFSGLTSDTRALVGEYSETVTVLGDGTESRLFNSRGAFALNRVSDLPTLTTE